MPPFFFAFASGLLIEGRNVTFPSMGRKVALMALAFVASPGTGSTVAPLYDPVVLNVGINCQWQQRCERRQLDALSNARRYITRAHPPVWRIHLCNRNAARSAIRMDWIGFNDCIRNRRLKPPASRHR